ncbi:MAG: fibronectin type III domain-containing protein [Alistipes sp.]|nr:fibronectin type III domain-containing protein [Alistipes sp.]
MKKLFATLFGLTALLFAGCSDDSSVDQPAPEASVAIAELEAGENSATFRLIPTDAASLSYRISTAQGEGDLIRLDSGEEQTVTAEHLTADTDYVLTAVAYNRDGKASKPAVERFRTHPRSVSDLPYVAIRDVQPTYNSVTFTLKASNAFRFGYKITKTPDEEGEMTFYRNTDEQTVEVKGLSAATEYIITAVAYDEEGNAYDPETRRFTTAAFPEGPASIEISEIKVTHSSITFTLTPELALRYAYKVDAADGEAEMTVVEGSEAGTYVVGNLKAETRYLLTAIAYNGKEEPSEPATHSFTTPAYEPFMQLEAVATAHGIYIRTEIDSEKHPLYFLQVFDPALTYTSADFSEQFKVDSREQFIRYLEVGSLGSELRTASMSEWNKTMLASSSPEVLLYAVPVGRQGADIVCSDYGEILEMPLTFPARDVLGAGSAAVALAEPIVKENGMEVALSLQGDPVAYMVGLATQADIRQAGTPEQYVQRMLDANEYDHFITSTNNFSDTWETASLSSGTDYCLFSLAYGADGKLGPLQTRTFSTENDIAYNKDYTVDAALKSAAFTSATFSIKRNGFTNGKYAFVTRSVFDSAYEGDLDKFIQQQLIGGYAQSLYSDNDIKGSRLEYDTEYLLVILPVVNGEYGMPATVEFRTLGYEPSGQAQVAVAVDSIEDFYGVSNYARVTVTPDAGCAGYYYLLLAKTTFDAAADLGETVCRNPDLNYRAATEAATFDTAYYYEDSYLVFIPTDSEGRMSEPVTSELLPSTAGR